MRYLLPATVTKRSHVVIVALNAIFSAGVIAAAVWAFVSLHTARKVADANHYSCGMGEAFAGVILVFALVLCVFAAVAWHAVRKGVWGLAAGIPLVLAALVTFCVIAAK